MIFTTKKKQEAQLNAARKECLKKLKAESRRLKETVQSYEIEITEKANKIEKLDIKVDMLECERDDVHSVMRQKLDQEDTALVLDQKKKALDARESRLNERSDVIDSEEEANYVKGYADGIADGLRKVHEITAEDRNNLSKIAMVSAASHTSAETFKEINNDLRITEGSKNKKA